MLIVYFSSVSENTHAFVHKLPYTTSRIPLRTSDVDEFYIDEPYVLVCPTYGGGATIHGEQSQPVPKQVIRFLNNEHNRNLIRGVIAGGNRNFGPDFGKAGDVISAKCGVPCLYRFELRGNEDDVSTIVSGIEKHKGVLGLE